MRTLTRKLLSLLLAFTMVCAMVPAAMASGEENPRTGTETNPPTEEPGTPGNTDGDTGDNEDGDGTGEGDGSEETPGPGDHKHVWDDGKVTKEATCTQDGEMTYTCTDKTCNDAFAVTRKWTSPVFAYGASVGLDWASIRSATIVSARLSPMEQTFTIHE